MESTEFVQHLSSASTTPAASTEPPADERAVTSPAKMPYQTPRSARGKKTRADLIDAARKIFVRDGFADSRISDIARRAKSSIGSFYTYFESKEEILSVVLAEAQADMLLLATMSSDKDDLERPLTAIRSAISAYLDFYQENVGLMLLIEQVSGIDSEFRNSKRQRELEHIHSNALVLAEWRDDGKADFAPDPFLVMNALSGMVNRFAYNNLAISSDFNLETAIDICVYTWQSVLGIRDLNDPPNTTANKGS